MSRTDDKRWHRASDTPSRHTSPQRSSRQPDAWNAQAVLKSLGITTSSDEDAHNAAASTPTHQTSKQKPSSARRHKPQSSRKDSSRSSTKPDAHATREPHSSQEDALPTDTAQQPKRVLCPVAERCGGCEWLGMPYELQLKLKRDHIEELFADYPVEVEPVIGMGMPDHYRNKIQLPFAPGTPNSRGRMTARWGIFERGSHRIVSCRECYVEDPAARPIIHSVAKLLPEFEIEPYSEHKGKGFLRYCLVRVAPITEQIMLTLVCNGDHLPHQDEFLARLLSKHPELTTIVLNVNHERTSTILGKEEHVLYGPGYIEDELCGCTFRISSSSFYQTNPYQAERLYDAAIDMADIRATDHIGDAYCGTGTIGIVAAKKSGARLLGVEVNAHAVADAQVNAQLNNIQNAEFIVGDAGSVFARMARAGESLDVVFMDPPRSGSNQAFLANLCRLSPRRIVYISCEPKTQRRDITQLVRNGYRVRRIVPVDMFPHTEHVEAVVLLSRVKD